MHNALPKRNPAMSAKHPIDLITIDLDDTLWPCLEPIRRAEDLLYAWLRERAPRLTQARDLASLGAHRRELMRRAPAIAHDLTAARRNSLGILLAAFGYAPTLADEAMALFLEHRNRVDPYADVVPVLRALAADYRLVSVTNGNSDVTRTPLRGLLHLSLTATDVGAARPDPALFFAALDWAGVEPWQALHLGDHPYLDVQAARDIGMQAVWVNRAGLAWPAELDPPLAEVADMNGLLGWLEDRAHGV